MNQWFKKSTLLLAALTSPLIANLDDDVWGSETLFTDNGAHGPFVLNGSADFIQKARITTRPFRRDKVEFGEADADLGFVFYYDDCHHEGLMATGGHTFTRLDWNHNPFFNQTTYNTLNLGITGFSNRLVDWLWQAQIFANFDLKHFKFADYTSFDFFLWGRHNFNESLGFHIGVIGYSGMKIDRVLPILGFDWQITDQIKLNAIYPLNISLVYQFDCNWSFALAGRAFESRHRVGKQEELSRGLWRYRNVGAELALNYDIDDWFHANIHAGQTFAGRLKVGDRNWDYRSTYCIKSAPYVGGDVSLHF